jgi:hypothetical protein
MKPGDLVRQRDIGTPNPMPGAFRRIGVVREIRKKDHARWKGTGWDSVKVYWGENHRMNERWVVRGALEVIDVTG